jgi:hypothetical protein
MIDWIIDRVWAWKHRGELADIDEEMRLLHIESARLDNEIEKEFGPNWRGQSRKRLSDVMCGQFTTS